MRETQNVCDAPRFDAHAVRHAIDTRLSGLTASPQQQAQVLRLARGMQMRRPRKIGAALVFALLIVALCATAYAAAMHFGLLHFNSEQQDNPEYISHIKPLGQHFDSAGVSFDIVEAIYDGEMVSIIFSMGQAPDAAPLYVYPTLSAQSGSQPLQVSVSGTQVYGENAGEPSFSASESGFGYTHSGAWIPQQGASTLYYALNAQISAPQGDAPVTFTLSIDVLSPALALCEEDVLMEQSWAQIEEALQACYARGEIPQSDHRLITYAQTLPAPDGVPQEKWDATDAISRLLLSGTFTRKDALSFTFSASQPEVLRLAAPQTFDLGQYECTVTDLTLTFSGAEYALYVRKKRDDGLSAAQEFMQQLPYWAFVITTPQGDAWQSMSGISAGEEDPCLYYTGSYTLTQPVRSLTFTPLLLPADSHDMTPDGFSYDGYQPTQEESEYAFTIEL